MEKEQKKINEKDTSKQTEEFFSILESCTPAQKQYFAGVLEGMKFQQAVTDQRSA